MASEKKPPSSQDLSDEIERLKDDMAALKQRYSKPPDEQLEQALAALAVARPHPMSPQEKGLLFEEIQVFKHEISALKSQIAQTEEKLSPEENAQLHAKAESPPPPRPSANPALKMEPWVQPTPSPSAPGKPPPRAVVIPKLDLSPLPKVESTPPGPLPKTPSKPPPPRAEELRGKR